MLDHVRRLSVLAGKCSICWCRDERQSHVSSECNYMVFKEVIKHLENTVWKMKEPSNKKWCPLNKILRLLTWEYFMMWNQGQQHQVLSFIFHSFTFYFLNLNVQRKGEWVKEIQRDCEYKTCAFQCYHKSLLRKKRAPTFTWTRYLDSSR